MVESLPIKNEKDISEIEDGQSQENYFEEIEKKAESQVTDIAVQDDNQSLANVVVDQPTVLIPANAVILPATQSGFTQGTAAPVTMSAKWLTTWCVFMIKKYGSRVFFKGE